MFPYASSLLPVLDVSLLSFLLLLCITEEVSARIVQVVTAEAVAVLKGEQEKEAEHKVQPAALPLGKWERTLGQGLCLLCPDHRTKSSCSKEGPTSYFILTYNVHQTPLLGGAGTCFHFLPRLICGIWTVFRVISL